MSNNEPSPANFSYSYASPSYCTASKCVESIAVYTLHSSHHTALAQLGSVGSLYMLYFLARPAPPLPSSTQPAGIKTYIDTFAYISEW